MGSFIHIFQMNPLSEAIMGTAKSHRFLPDGFLREI